MTHTSLVRCARAMISALVLAVLAVACTREEAGPRPGAPLPETATQSYRSCAADSECTYVQNGCCDCANGGEELAINRQHVDAFRALFKCGPDTRCTLVDRIPACGSGKVSCVAGMCSYQL